MDLVSLVSVGPFENGGSIATATSVEEEEEKSTWIRKDGLKEEMERSEE